jgi:apolipoprotein N-acyltransferase
MKKILFLAILSGVLFSVGWPTYGFPLFLFFGFVPLLFIEEHFLRNRQQKGFFLYIYLAFFIWNLATTWWVYNSTAVGGVFAVVVNSLLMTTTFWLFHFVRKRLPDSMALFFFPAIWIAFEKFHLNWAFSWPWLNIGNGFSDYPAWIQWYEYTGVFGGALWILVVNLVFYKGLSKYLNGDKVSFQKNILRTTIIKTVLLIIIPLGISLLMYQNYQEKGKSASVLLLQPNLNPFTEKFKYSNTQAAQNLLELVQQKTDVIIAPETAISQYTEIDNFKLSSVYKIFKQFSDEQNTAVITGVDFIHWYDKNANNIPETANKNRRGRSYNMYNSAVLIDGDNYQIYHKSKLVVGAEYTPFQKILVPLIGDWVTKTIGVSMGSNVTQNERSVFHVANSQLKIAPIICYESIYGEYVTDYVKKDANLLAVITNDGWWGNTQGYKQHLSLARLRAVETRRDVVQSANTGISAHINQKGQLVKQLGYEKRGSVLANVKLNEDQTFYTQQGDYIARVAVFMAILLFLYSFARKKVRL